MLHLFDNVKHFVGTKFSETYFRVNTKDIVDLQIKQKKCM